MSTTQPPLPVCQHESAWQIIQREQLIDALSAISVLITGASDGIGLETARALFHTGATLYLPCRDPNKAARMQADIEGDGLPGKGRIHLLHVDLKSLASVRQCASAVLALTPVLHVLICNAGAYPQVKEVTEDGLEVCFAVNHAAHFLLFQLLQPAMLAASASSPTRRARLVCVASAGHMRSPAFLGDYSMDAAGYDAFLAYGSAKTCNIYMALEVQRRYGHVITGLAVDPGVVLDTQLTRDMTDEGRGVLLGRVKDRAKTAGQGAATTVWAAVGAEWEGKGGVYLECVKVSLPRGSEDATAGEFGYGPHAYDTEAAKMVWTDSLAIVGVDDDSSR